MQGIVVIQTVLRGLTQGLHSEVVNFLKCYAKI